MVRSCWSSGWIQNHTEQETGPLFFHNSLIVTCLQRKQQHCRQSDAWCSISHMCIVSFVAVHGHCFYSIYTKVVCTWRSVPQFPVRFCFMTFVLLWFLQTELCREWTERIRTLGLFCWKALIFYFLGLHDRQKSLPKTLHEKTTHTTQNTLKWQSDCQ